MEQERSGPRTVSYHTLGCKVNQYDTQAMREAFEAAGYRTVPFGERADVCLINTCTVTGTGDKKSLQLIRRCARQNPRGDIIVAGCLAQRAPERVRLPGVRLVLGTQRRAEVVALYERAVREDCRLVAAESLAKAPFEPLSIRSQPDRIRAYMKIQEGCNRYCSYCIIPAVRGPIRSRRPEEIEREARALAEAGYPELVLTGIHLTSYGLDLRDGTALEDAIARVHAVPSVLRIRLGSLEPVVVTDRFIRALRGMPKVCPQFHLALQSGSDAVLSRMRRRYTAAEFLRACGMLREAFEGCTITTDIVTGFPGETEADFAMTAKVCEAAGFARMHVFPYSEREGTAAALMDGKVPVPVREARARELIALGKRLERRAMESFAGRTVRVLVESLDEEGSGEGYTEGYLRARVPGAGAVGEIVRARVTGFGKDTLLCEACE